MELMIDAELVKQLRKEKSWTQEQLAQVSGISLRTVQRIEKQGVCSLESRQALASVFEVSASELQSDEEEKKRNRFYRKVLLMSYLGNTLGWLSSFAGTTYSFVNGRMTGAEAGMAYGTVALIAGFFYVFVALLLEYFRKHRIGEWQRNI